MQPDDPSITPVSTAASATVFSIFLVLFVLIGRAFLRINRRGSHAPTVN
jgi:hypothetical protein